MGRFPSLRLAVLAVAMAAVGLAAPSSAAAAESSFRVAWSIYAGWMPWGYAADSGIMKKWADRYGITVEVTRVDSYLQSIDQYTAGAFDGCAMTNVDALTMPAAAGVDSTSLLVGDFSSGNDGIVLKDATRLQDIAGRRVLLVKFSVSHYLLARASRAPAWTNGT
jgi:NitT/TauT family transport system substrate-binding protein